MTIRPLAAADIDAVIAIAEGLAEAPQWPRPAWLAAVDPAARPERLALVAVDEDGSIAGFVVLAVIAGEAELESIGVDGRVQRRGIGRALMESAMPGLRSAGCVAVHLEVRASNLAARGLYATQGFVETGRRSGYYAGPVEDAVLMRMELSGSETGASGPVCR